MQYTVVMYTGKQDGAGTDGDVYLTLFGENGSSQRTCLDNDGDDRESGDIDTYAMDAKDLGELSQCYVEVNGDGWFLEKIIVSDTNGSTWTFPCGRWLAKDEDDRRTERWLPAKNSNAASRAFAKRTTKANAFKP